MTKLSKLLVSLVILTTLASNTFAATFGKWQGYAEQGGNSVSVAGYTSSTKVQRSFPGATVSVYLTGTTTLATIYSDQGSTTKANPFTADSHGFVSFYINTSTQFDITFSGVGITTPFTLSGLTAKLAFGGIPSVLDYGAVNDGRTVTGSVSNGIPTLTLTSGSFSAADVGRSFTLLGAGGTGIGLSGTITAVGSSTSASISSTPSANVISGTLYIATDSTAAFQNAIDNSLSVVIPSGVFGITNLRLNYGQSLIGAGFGATSLLRIGLGTGGPAISMKSSTLAQGIRLANLDVRCGQLGTNVDCIQLGYEVVGGGYALGASIENLAAWDASGFGVNLAFNTATIRNIWVENQNSSSQSTAAGFKAAVTDSDIDNLQVEGFMPGGAVVLNASGMSSARVIRLQLQGTYPSTDMISIGASGQTIDGVYIFGTGTYRDVVRILAGQQFNDIRHLVIDSTHPTFTNTINDLQYSRTYSYTHLLRYTQAIEGGIETVIYPTYANNAGAVAAGLTVGAMYQDTSGFIRIVQ